MYTTTPCTKIAPVEGQHDPFNAENQNDIPVAKSPQADRAVRRQQRKFNAENRNEISVAKSSQRDRAERRAQRTKITESQPPVHVNDTSNAAQPPQKKSKRTTRGSRGYYT
jgi:hypothetical protein